MNYTQSFEEFSRSLNTTDLALYAGIGIVLWVLFQDKLNPLKELIFNKLFNTVPKPSIVSIKPCNQEKEDVFFALIASWKTTRDLAVKNGCTDAVKVIDTVFPYLSPNICKDRVVTNEIK